MWTAECFKNLEDAQGAYSDYYKDINGFRPRGILIPDTMEEVLAGLNQLAAQWEAERWENLPLKEKNAIAMENYKPKPAPINNPFGELVKLL